MERKPGTKKEKVVSCAECPDGVLYISDVEPGIFNEQEFEVFGSVEEMVDLERAEEKLAMVPKTKYRGRNRTSKAS